MTQQEKDKIIKLLDERLPPFRKFGRAINANSILSVNEQDILYDTVKSYSEEEISYIEAIQRVVDIINRHPEVRDFDKAYNNAGTPLVGIEMPFLLKQVLFYIYYLKRKNDKDMRLNFMLGDLASAGLTKTKKFLNVGGMTPEGYYCMESYKQPLNPCLYKGQKKGELAYAIKNLAYQAGAFSYYVDIFGGSGAATTALYPQDRVKQVYNEINEVVYNLFNVLASDEYMKVVSLIEEVQSDLSRTDYNFSKKFDKLSKDIERWKSNGDCPFNQISTEEEKVLDKFNSDFDFDSNAKVPALTHFQEVLNRWEDSDDIIEQSGFKIEDVYSWKTTADFDEHWKDIEVIQKKLGTGRNNRFRITQLTGVIKDMHGNIVDCSERYCNYKIYVTQVKALIYYLYFNNIRADKKIDKIERAVAEIYLHNLGTQGSIISSSILAYDRGEHDDYKKRTEIDKFIQDSHSKIIINFHNRIKRCYNQKLIYNKDFKDIIREFGNRNGNVLFYCDSSYESTSDYTDKKARVNPFNSNRMKELIDELVKSKKKFIFSMRAVGTGDYIEKRKNVTKAIKRNVYEVFKDKKIKNLHVLCILQTTQNNKYDSKQLIENYKNGVSNCEIMLTNYQIVEFKEWRKSEDSKTIYKFKVYKFADFMKIIEGVI